MLQIITIELHQPDMIKPISNHIVKIDYTMKRLVVEGHRSSGRKQWIDRMKELTGYSNNEAKHLMQGNGLRRRNS